MRLLLSRISILLALIGLIALPVFLTTNLEMRRAETALADGRPLAAAADFEHLARLLFWRTDLWERAGRAAFAGGDLPNAIRLLGQSPGLSAAGWADLCAAHYQSGQYEEAARACQRGLDAYGGADAFLYRGLVLAFNAQGDLQAETSALQKYLVLQPGEAAAHYRLGMLLSLFEPQNALSELMISAQLEQEYDPAVQTMRTTLNLASLESSEARRLVVTGRGLGLVQEWPLACEAFQRAARAEPGYAEAWAWLGEAKQHLGSGGREELQRAETLDPFSANVRALFGLYWKRKEEPLLALAEFQWAALLEPENPAFQTALAEAYVQAGDLPPALAAYQRAIELAPKDAAYWRQLAAFCARYTYQIEEIGLPAAEKVLALHPDEAASHDLLGWLYFSVNALDKAETEFRSALRLNPDFPAAHLHLGMLYLQQNKTDLARLHLQRAQELDPQGADGRLAAQMLAQYFP